MSVRVALKTVRIMGPDVKDVATEDVPMIEEQIENVVQNISWDFIEETISDLVPAGYYCKIED